MIDLTGGANQRDGRGHCPSRRKSGQWRGFDPATPRGAQGGKADRGASGGMLFCAARRRGRDGAVPGRVQRLIAARLALRRWNIDRNRAPIIIRPWGGKEGGSRNIPNIPINTHGMLALSIRQPGGK